MKIGIFTVLYAGKTFEEMLDFVAENGVESVEIGTGNWPGNAHCKMDELLADKEKLKNFKSAVEDRGLTISALSCHGNALHPDKKFAAANHETHRKTILLAERLGVDTVVTFSGCPGDSERSKYPNWVTCPWPEDFLAILDWQWNKVVIPYWKKEAAFAKSHGVKKIALEMHPGFVVYNPETLLKLREAAGTVIGANFDPSHLFWQGIDPVAAIKKLNKAIYHFHAKDTKIDRYNTAVNGVLDTKNYGDIPARSWVFRTVGYGNGQQVWREMISALRAAGYNGALSIEHEDGLMSINEGFKKAVAFLKESVITEKPSAMWWA